MSTQTVRRPVGVDELKRAWHALHAGEFRTGPAAGKGPRGRGSAADRYLLLCLVEEAGRVETRNLARGYGGLLSNEVSSRVAPRVGVSEATVRRHGSRSMRALAEAAPRKFGHDE